MWFLWDLTTVVTGQDRKPRQQGINKHIQVPASRNSKSNAVTRTYQGNAVHPHPTAEPEKAWWGSHIPPQRFTEKQKLTDKVGQSNPCHFRKAKNMYLHRITLNLNIAKRGKKVIGETQENKILNAGRGKRAKSLNPKLQVGVADLQSDAKRRVLPSFMHCLGWECSLSAEQELCSSAAGEAYCWNKHFLTANTAPNSMIITFAGLSSRAPTVENWGQ